jgi:hypothetical protein
MKVKYEQQYLEWRQLNMYDDVYLRAGEADNETEVIVPNWGLYGV